MSVKVDPVAPYVHINFDPNKKPSAPPPAASHPRTDPTSPAPIPGPGGGTGGGQLPPPIDAIQTPGSPIGPAFPPLQPIPTTGINNNSLSLVNATPSNANLQPIYGRQTGAGSPPGPTGLGGGGPVSGSVPDQTQVASPSEGITPPGYENEAEKYEALLVSAVAAKVLFF